MRRALAALLALATLLAPARAAHAQAANLPNTNGGTTTILSGTTPITGGADTQLCFNDGAFISCGDAGLVYAKATDILTMLGGATIGSISTAGRAKTMLLDTISGSSATSNFLNITGTQVSSLSAAHNSVYLSTTTGGSSAQPVSGLFSTMAAGYTGTNRVSSGRFENATASTGALSGFISGTGGSVGVEGRSSAGTTSVGTVGYCTGGTDCIGVFGAGGGGTRNVGGLFNLGGNGTTVSASAALIVDNNSLAVDIMRLMDNSTPVLTVGDGGIFTHATTLAFNMVNGSCSVTGSTGLLGCFNGGQIGFSSAANTVGISTLDTFFSREAAATMQLGADVNGAAVAQTLKAHDGITGTDIAGANFTLAGGRGTGAGANGLVKIQTALPLATGTTAQTLRDAAQFGKVVTLTEAGAAETVITITTATTQTFGLELSYRVTATDATNRVTREGSLKLVCDNAAGTVTCAKDATAQTDDESVVIATGGATLTYAIAADVATANVAKITFDIDSSLVVSAASITFTAILNGSGTIS